MVYFQEICRYCGRQYHELSELRIHLKDQHNKETFSCALCQKHFSRLDSLERHKQMQHGPTEKRHFNKPLKKFKCMYCGKKFKCQEYRRAHWRRHVDAFKKDKCTKCGKKFHTAVELQRHLKLRHDETTKDYSCNICNKSFKTKDTLNQHVSGHERNMYCLFCQKKFENLLDHTKWRHLGKKFFQCETCGAMFSSQRQLTGHGKMHSNRTSTRHR